MKDDKGGLVAQPDRSRLLMNDSLRSTFGDIDPFDVGPSKHVEGITVAIDRSVGATRAQPLVGQLTTLLMDESPEIELVSSINIAFGVVKDMGETNMVLEIQLHHGDDVMSIVGPYEISMLRVQDINVHAQTCVIAMKLTKQPT